MGISTDVHHNYVGDMEFGIILLRLTCFVASDMPHTSLCRYTRWFKYDQDCLHLFTHKSVPVIFEPPCIYKENFVFSNVFCCV